MRRLRTVPRCVVSVALVVALFLLAGVSPGAAVLDQPDAMFYGSVFDSGKPAASGVVVQARSGQTVIDSFQLGADSFYALRIPIAQSTANDETPPSGSVFNGSTVQLFVGYHSAGEVTTHSGVITRRDLTAGLRLCSGGSKDGQECMGDGDCPSGLCVVAQALCDGGSEDGMRCQCIGSTCGAQPACAENAAMGTCSGGPLAGECCDLGMNCADGAACTGSQKICAGGTRKGFPCLRDTHCPGSSCSSTGKVCNGGTQDGFACSADTDCGGGTCGARIATPTPTRTPTRVTTGGPGTTPTPTATPTRTPGGVCVGDCDGTGGVTINELIIMVNVALENSPPAACLAGDVNGDQAITINEIITAVGNALNGCPAAGR